jgi:signal-transduction protein with cAMP-binding, CBS, and nucleotidyltransferase domain
VRETAKNIIDGTRNDDNTLDKLLYLAGSDLFSSLKTDHLIDIAYQAKLKKYYDQEIILEQGTFNQEFFLLIRGQVASVDRQEIFTPICLLNELEILAQIPQNNTLIADNEITTIITIDRNWFEDLFALDRDFARQVLGKETSKRLQITFN